MSNKTEISAQTIFVKELAADIFRVFRLFSDKRAYEKPCRKYCRKQRRNKMEQYNEILKLKTMLEEAGIVFDFYPRKDLHDEWGCYQICYPADEGRVCSVIEGALTYGGVCDRLEIMGLLTKEERKDGTVKGWLTAEDVFARIKKHWEENYGKRY